MKRYISQNSVRKKQSHFINSLFVQSGIYSCVVDCFLEGSRYLFLPKLSKLSKRSEFPELLFTAANSSCLPAIREPVWLYLRALSQRGSCSVNYYSRRHDDMGPNGSWVQKLAPVFFEGVSSYVTCFPFSCQWHCVCYLQGFSKVLERGLCLGNIECRRNLRISYYYRFVIWLCTCCLGPAEIYFY